VKNLSEEQSRVWSTISIILGVVCFIIFGLPLGLVAIITGAVAVAQGDDRGYIGVALGVVGALIAFFLLMAFF